MQNRRTLMIRAASGAMCLLLFTAIRADAQKTESSTTAGVYTQEQAARGADVFAGMCKSCHTPSVHTGPVFLKTWADRPLWDLYEFISTKMPKNDPGGMFPEEYAQVVSYLLKLNGQPAGPSELPSDSLFLKTIRFEAADKIRKEQ